MLDMLNKKYDGFVESSVLKVALASQDVRSTLEDVTKSMEKFNVEGNEILNVVVFVRVMKA